MSIGVFILITILVVFIIFGGIALIGTIMITKSNSKDETSENAHERKEDKK